jgi:hypothetical protein
VKKYKMDMGAVKELLFGGVQQLAKDRRFYYHSTVGVEYSYWTEEGHKALAEYMNLMVCQMLKAEEKELNQRAKNLVINGLKGETI